MYSNQWKRNRQRQTGISCMWDQLPSQRSAVPCHLDSHPINYCMHVLSHNISIIRLKGTQIMGPVVQKIKDCHLGSNYTPNSSYGCLHFVRMPELHHQRHLRECWSFPCISMMSVSGLWWTTIFLHSWHDIKVNLFILCKILGFGIPIILLMIRI